MILRIDNSISQLIGLTPDTLKAFRKILCYEPPAAQAHFSGSFRCNTRYLIDKQGFFPTGLCYLVEKHCQKLCINLEVQDKRVKPTKLVDFPNYKLPYTPYPEQEAAARTAINSVRSIICAPTGFGKSVTLAILVRLLRLKTLIVVPNLTLKHQLRQSFIEIFGSLDNITIENIDSPELQKPEQYDVLILDEAHHAAAKTYRDLNKRRWTGIYYRFFFTATAFRSRSEENILFESIAGEVSYKILHQEAVAKGYICPIEAYYYELPKQTTGTATTWPEVYSKLVTVNDARNRLIANLLDTLQDSQTSTLCLVREIKHGINIDAHRESPGVFVKGENDDNRIALLEFNLREKSVMLATVGVMGEGADSKPCEYVILAGLGKSRNQLMQCFGRGFRVYPGKESCKVILFKDPSHRWTLTHFREQCRVLKEEYGVVPTKLPLPKDYL